MTYLILIECKLKAHLYEGIIILAWSISKKMKEESYYLNLGGEREYEREPCWIMASPLWERKIELGSCNLQECGSESKRGRSPLSR